MLLLNLSSAIMILQIQRSYRGFSIRGYIFVNSKRVLNPTRFVQKTFISTFSRDVKEPSYYPVPKFSFKTPRRKG
jgi:hypothetical protein